MKRISPIRQRMIEDMQLHGYSAKTQTAYLGAFSGLARHYHRSPEDITPEELRSYFIYLVKGNNCSAGGRLGRDADRPGSSRPAVAKCHDT